MSRWSSGRSGRQGEEARAAQNGAVAAFLDLDTRQRFVADAVGAASALQDPMSGPPRRSGLERAWDTVEQQCFTASSHYLAVSQAYPAESVASESQQAAAAYHQVHVELADASTAIDAFYQQYRSELDQARMAVAASPNVARNAREAAAAALERAIGHPEVSGYRSVLRAQEALDQACDVLDHSTSVGAVRSAAQQVSSAATALDEAVQAAEKAGEVALTTMNSVRTRIDALALRTERLADTNSALLREFAAASTRDLTGNIGEARRHLAEGERDWQQAKEMVRTGDAEAALERLHAAREHLAEGDAAGKGLTERLRELRDVRADPEAALKQARFRVRDAQRLVVDRGLIPEWGSVLDAQSARLDRAADALTGVHPDYWAYLGELRSVTAFVSGVVDRVRNQVSGR